MESESASAHPANKVKGSTVLLLLCKALWPSFYNLPLCAWSQKYTNCVTEMPFISPNKPPSFW